MTDKRAGAAGKNAADWEGEFAVGNNKDVGNRPANNAHLATPAAARAQAQSWQAQNGASDFLGLDQELSGRTGQPAMIAPPPVAVAQQLSADESWLMEMTENPDAPAPVEASYREPVKSLDDTQSDALLNSSWREPVRATRKRSFVAPLVACGLVGVLALVGWPMLQRATKSTDSPASGDVAKASAPLHPWDRDSGAEPAAQPAPQPEPEPVAVVAPAREEPPASFEPAQPTPQPPAQPQFGSREVADARTEVAAPSEQASSVDGLVEVVPLAGSSHAPSSGSSLASAHVETPALAGSSSSSGYAGSASEQDAGALHGDEDEAYSEDDTSVPPEFVNPLAQPEPEVQQPLRPAKTTSVVSAPPSGPVKPAPEPVLVVTPVAKSTPEPIAPAPKAVASTVPSETPRDVAPPAPAPSPVRTEPAAPEHASTPVVAASASSTPPTGAVALGSERREPAVTPQPATVTGFVGPSAGAPSPAQPFDQASTFGPAPAASNGAEWIALNDGQPKESARTTQLAVEDVLLLGDGGEALRQASVKELSGVWSQSTVPPRESISSPTKMLTPTVGKVRVVLSSGEMFEGGLYAVGEGSVWIDSQYGRMGLAGSRVKSVVQIDSPKGTPALGAPGSQDLGGLERVRVKTAGGYVFGKVIERDGKKT